MTQPIWYYEKDNQIWGPLYEEEIIILISESSITANTLLWAEPMDEWAPAHAVEEYKRYFVRKPPILPADERLVTDETVTESIPPLPVSDMDSEKTTPLPPEQMAFRAPDATGKDNWRTFTSKDQQTRAVYSLPYPVIPIIDGVSQVQPWNRFMAKMVDYSILLIIMYVLQAVFFPPLKDLKILDTLFELLSWPLAGLFLVLFEPAFISRYGRTPGKHIFGISVRHRDGSLLTYAEARTRTYNVWVNGLGFNVFIVSWITMLYQYDRLIRKGITSWDRDGDFVTTHKSYDFFLSAVIYTIYICYLTYETLDYYFTKYNG